MTRDEYRKWHTAYVKEIGAYTWLPLPNAITRKPNRHPLRWMPRVKFRMVPR